MYPEILIPLLIGLSLAITVYLYYRYGREEPEPPVPEPPIILRAWAGATPSICWPDRSYPVYAFVVDTWPEFGLGGAIKQMLIRRAGRIIPL